MGLYSTISSSNTSEMIAERRRAQAAEKAAFGYSVLEQVQGPYYSSNTLQSDVYTCKDGCDDGRISFGEKVSNFCNGVVAPIKNIFASPKNMLVAGLTIAAGAGLIALTGGAAAPVMVALGLVGGGTQIASGLYKQATATTDAQAAQAWNQMGSGTFTVGTSILGAKASLKAAGVQNVSNMTTKQAVVSCLKDAPSFFSNAVKTASPKVSAFWTSLKSTKPNSTPKPETQGAVPRLNAPKSKAEVFADRMKKAQARRKQPVTPDVIEMPASTQPRLALPEPKNIPQYKIDYNVGDDFPQNVKFQVASKGAEKPLGLPATKSKTTPSVVSNQSSQRLALPEPPKRLALPEPKVTVEPVSTSKNTNVFRTFINNIASKVKESFKLFGISVD